MCGIAGLIHPDLDTVREAVSAMTGAQAHRGPDDEGTDILPWGKGYLGLGHRRLAILDLSPAGHQPMAHPPTGSLIVFNGEIYNFRALRRELEHEGESFRGGSDTEVLLAGLVRHGEAFLTRLEGMFAFAFHDVPRQRLLLARDPTGIKPLYLARVGEMLLFASEVRAILASGLVPPKVDRRGAAGLLAYGAVQHPLTLFRDIASLPPGCCQSFMPAAKGWTTTGPHPFWRYPSLRTEIGKDEAVSAVRDTLDAAVANHLVSDVPVGVFLSSGLDSTIIAGLAGRHSPHIQSFTVGFADQPEFSEQDAAAETARLFGLRHTAIELPAADAEEATHEWLAALDQPSMDGLNVFVISRAVRRHGIRVALSGLGSDELFGGYPSFRDVPRLHRWLRRLRWLPPAARRCLARLPGLGRSESFRRKLTDLFGSSCRFTSLYLHRRRALSDAQMGALGIDASALDLTADFQPPEVMAAGLPEEGDDPVRAVGELESRFYQGNMLLRDADANGMAHGLEIRVPFLDRRLLDLVHALPGSVRLPHGMPGKYLLRQAFDSLLRPELQRQAKRGFTLPISRWMVGPLRGWCEQSLGAWKELGWLHPEAVAAVWAAFLCEPESPLWTRVFTLCVTGHYLAQVGAAS